MIHMWREENQQQTLIWFLLTVQVLNTKCSLKQPLIIKACIRGKKKIGQQNILEKLDQKLCMETNCRALCYEYHRKK